MIETFGNTSSGETVQVITLKTGDLTARILTWGAILQSARLDGVSHDLTLGSDRLEDYLGDLKHHGSLIGPVVNRLTNAEATIAGQRHQFEVNFNGRHTLHSGVIGCHRQNWTVVEADDNSCILALTLPAGAGGFPGTRHLRAAFTVQAPASLTMSVSATTDAETILNFANHSYWNLDGTQTWTGHSLQIAADAFLPNDADFKPTGEICPVTGTDMDFREPRAITPGAPAMDNCFVLGRGQQPLRDVLWLTGTSGVTMTVATTEPGVQVYDQRGVQRTGQELYEGIAVECQGWPDAPTHPHFPQINVKPGKTLTQVTKWAFSR
jgi:aldose 1-epimerase